jgi:hypothetical protein
VPPRDQNASYFTKRADRVGHVLEEPHHPDVVERSVVVWELKAVGRAELRRDSPLANVIVGHLDLACLEIDARKRHSGECFSEDPKHRAYAAADLEQPRSRR